MLQTSCLLVSKHDVNSGVSIKSNFQYVKKLFVTAGPYNELLTVIKRYASVLSYGSASKKQTYLQR